MSTPATNLVDVNFEGQLLIAMPGMPDERFARSVICVCAHSDEGAMGLIINKQADNLSFGTLLEHIDLDDDDIDLESADAERPVYNGGPVENSRGFVLHSPDYFAEGATVTIAEGICLTATTDILKAIALGKGPKKLLLALGYSGWAPGQLESEIAGNGWLTCAADADLVFDEALATKHAQALAKLGIDPSHLVGTAGRA